MGHELADFLLLQFGKRHLLKCVNENKGKGLLLLGVEVSKGVANVLELVVELLESFDARLEDVIVYS